MTGGRVPGSMYSVILRWELEIPLAGNAGLPLSTCAILMSTTFFAKGFFIGPDKCMWVLSDIKREKYIQPPFSCPVYSDPRCRWRADKEIISWAMFGVGRRWGFEEFANRLSEPVPGSAQILAPFENPRGLIPPRPHVLSAPAFPSHDVVVMTYAAQVPGPLLRRR